MEGLIDGVASTPEMQKKYLTTIKAKAEELEGMVARILSYSRLELNDAPRDAAVLRLDAFLQSEIAALSADYAERGLDMTAELAPFAVVADVSELKQLLTNIADNSLKYKDKERCLLHITLTDMGGVVNCLLPTTDPACRRRRLNGYSRGTFQFVSRNPPHAY